MSEKGHHVQAFLLCDSVVRDQASSKAFVLGVFERIFANSFPAVHPNMAAYFRVGFRGGAWLKTVALMAAHPQGAVTKISEINLPQQHGNFFEGGINIQGFQFPQPGDYTFYLFLDGKESASFTVSVVPLKAQPAANPMVLN